MERVGRRFYTKPEGEQMQKGSPRVKSTWNDPTVYNSRYLQAVGPTGTGLHVTRLNLIPLAPSPGQEKLDDKTERRGKKKIALRE